MLKKKINIIRIKYNQKNINNYKINKNNNKNKNKYHKMNYKKNKKKIKNKKMKFFYKII